MESSPLRQKLDNRRQVARLEDALRRAVEENGRPPVSLRSLIRISAFAAFVVVTLVLGIVLTAGTNQLLAQSGAAQQKASENRVEAFIAATTGDEKITKSLLVESQTAQAAGNAGISSGNRDSLIASISVSLCTLLLGAIGSFIFFEGIGIFSRPIYRRPIRTKSNRPLNHSK